MLTLYPENNRLLLTGLTLQIPIWNPGLQHLCFISKMLLTMSVSVKSFFKNIYKMCWDSEVHITCADGMYSPTCLLCCLVLRRTICRMLELVMSDTTSDTRFHTRNRAPHNMWYWRRRIPCRHSWPSSIFLHFPFLERGDRKMKVTSCTYAFKWSQVSCKCYFNRTHVYDRLEGCQSCYVTL